MGLNNSKSRKCFTTTTATTEESANELEYNNSSSCNTVFNNHLILENILKSFDLDSLKKLRLVNKLWAKTATKIVSLMQIHIELELHIPPSDFIHLENFIVKNGIEHILFVSFLTPPWYDNYIYPINAINADGDSRAGDSYIDPKKIKFNSKQLKIVKFVKVKNKILDCLSQIGSFCQDLRLEMNLLNKFDAQLLQNLLSKSQTIKRVNLDFVCYSEKGILCVNTLNSLLHQNCSLGIRFMDECFEDYKISMEAFLHLIRGFPNIESLDLIGWKQIFSVDNSIRTNMLKSILTIQENNSLAFANLSKIRCEVWNACDINVICSLSKILKLKQIYLDGRSCFKHINNSLKLHQIWEILQTHSKTLERFDLTWTHGNGSLLFHNLNNPDYTADADAPIAEQYLPYVQTDMPYMPNLKSLAIELPAKFDESEGWKLETLDPFGLRKVFLESVGNNLRQLPSLNTLCISMYYETGDEIWEHIFPQQNISGAPIKITSLKNLMISLSVDCDSPKIKRLQKIFPSLKLFRHARKDSMGVVSCDHRFNSDIGDESKTVVELRKLQKSFYSPDFHEEREDLDWTTSDYKFHAYNCRKMYALLRRHKTTEFD